MTIHHLVIPVANASRGNPTGAAVAGWYRVENGAVVICTEDGMPAGDKRKIGEGETARVVAARLLKREWEDKRDWKSDFHRPLSGADYAEWKY